MVEAVLEHGVIISGHFRPEAALLANSHLVTDPGTGGPAIDQFGQCSDPAYYAAGNLLRPAETAGFCWQEGTDTARRVAWELTHARNTRKHTVRLRSFDPSIGFVLPQRLTLSGRPFGMRHMQIGLCEPVDGKLTARICGRRIWQGRLKSRPVRRIRRPLASILDSHPSTDVELTLER